MSYLPKHGKIKCDKCFINSTPIFDQEQEECEGWRIKLNPLAWGNQNPEVVILGFSKGPTQAGALTSTPHNEIAYKGSRLNVGKIMAHVGLIPLLPLEKLKKRVDELISDPNCKFHFGSLIRCTVEIYDEKTKKWKGSGGGMLDKFVATEFGQFVSGNCTKEYLGKLPNSTKLVLMFGLGTKQNYVKEAFKLYNKSRPGKWSWINEVSYTDQKIIVVHVEHFASQGALIPNWLGKNDHERSRFGILAQGSVAKALGNR